MRYVDAPPLTARSKSSLSLSLSLERVRASMRQLTPEDTLSATSSSIPERKDAFDDVAVQFDPKAFAKEHRSSSFDVFGAIDAVKNALGG